MTDVSSIRYFDHAATSWPKPAVVAEAMLHAMTDAGGNPGRSAHELALAAARAVEHGRTQVARLLGVDDSRDLVFVPGCTYGLNLALKGALKRGDRVVVSSVEHNAVARPLAWLSTAGVKVARVPADTQGLVDLDDIERAVAAAQTRMVVCQHASNVTGAIQPIGDIVDIAHEHGAVVVVDGAQAAGHLPLALSALGADAYVAPGHKGLLGPQGIGVLYLAQGFDPMELVQGGSGGHSEEVEQPRTRPDRYEAGTGNVIAAAGLGASAEYLATHADEIRARECALARRLHEGLLELPDISVLGPGPDEERVPVVSIVHARLAPDEMAFALDRRFGIAVRAGLHCSPWTHEAVGTLETGALRFSLGWNTSEDDVDAALVAMRELCR